MKLRVLGCGGGIGGSFVHTTALLVDHDILIDAGTGLTTLTLAEMAQIEHVFITHYRAHPPGEGWDGVTRFDSK